MIYRNPAILALAKIAPHCMCCAASNRGQVVAAHSNSNLYGKGAGLKAWDWAVAFACDLCHAYIDQGVITPDFPDECRGLSREEVWAKGHRNTFAWLFGNGHLVVRPSDYVEPVHAPKPKAKVPKGRPLPGGGKIHSRNNLRKVRA